MVYILDQVEDDRKCQEKGGEDRRQNFGTQPSKKAEAGPSSSANTFGSRISGLREINRDEKEQAKLPCDFDKTWAAWAWDCWSSAISSQTSDSDVTAQLF